MDSRSLTSLALLKLRLDQREGDAYSVFEPLVIDMLSRNRSAEITDERVAADFLAEFGLQIPTASMHHVLRRLARQGFLAKEYHQYRPTDKLVPVARLEVERRDAEENTRVVVDEFVDFYEKEFNKILSDDDAVKAILQFLDKFSVDCLRAYVFQSSLPKPQDRGIKNEYTVGRFIYWANKEAADLFQRIILLVQCQMCANAVLCPDLQSLDKKFGNVCFYIDAPILLNLVGLHGTPEQRSSLELLDLIKGLDGRLFAFEHSVFEVKAIINGSKRHLHNFEATSRVLRACRDSQFEQSDLDLAEESFESEISKQGISVIPTPDYVQEFQVSELDLTEFIKERVQHTRERATRVDVNSIRSIFVLRQGIVPLRLEDAGHVFVTDNGALARAAWDYSKQHNSYREVSPVIADYSLANIAWLKAPMNAPDLPVIETLALCYAAILPSQGFEEKLLHTVDSLRERGQIDASAHAAMRSSRAYEQELMRLTLGDEEDLKPATAMEALDRLKQELTVEHVSQITNLKAEKRSVAEKLIDAESTLERRSCYADKMSGRMAFSISIALYATILVITILAARMEFADVSIHGISAVLYWVAGVVMNLVAFYGLAFKFRQYLKEWFIENFFGIRPDEND